MARVLSSRRATVFAAGRTGLTVRPYGCGQGPPRRAPGDVGYRPSPNLTATIARRGSTKSVGRPKFVLN